MDNNLLQIIIGVAVFIGLLIFTLLLAYREGAAGATRALSQIQANTPALDAVEGAVDKLASPSQLDLFRTIVFPAFALGLAITPAGDLQEAIKHAQRITDLLTDSKPNVPAPGEGTPLTERDAIPG